MKKINFRLMKNTCNCNFMIFFEKMLFLIDNNMINKRFINKKVGQKNTLLEKNDI